MKGHLIRVAIIASLSLLACQFSACAKAHTTGKTEIQSQRQQAADHSFQPTTRPEMIYVSDFAIDVASVKEEGGILKRGPIREGLLGGAGLLHRGESADTTARKLVDTLSKNLVQELAAQSLPVMRLNPGMPLPSQGWLIRGQFLEMDKGNRLRRAVIGFGAGESNMEIEVEVIDLGSHPNTPFLVIGTRADSGKMPGAIVTMNPYVAAAKFVMSKNASEKDVKHSASRIASEISGYMKAHEL